MIKQLLNSLIAKYLDLSVSRRSNYYLPKPKALANNQSARHRQMTIFCSTSSNKLLTIDHLSRYNKHCKKSFMLCSNTSSSWFNHLTSRPCYGDHIICPSCFKILWCYHSNELRTISCTEIIKL